HSTDRTLEIIEYYARRDPCVRRMHRGNGRPGKPAALDDAIATATGDIVAVFDADYIPGRGLLRELVAPFMDPAVGAVMGRVVPQTWRVRTDQIRRWAIGHTQCFRRFAWKMLTEPGLRSIERVDAVMLLGIYLIAPLLALALIASLFLFFKGGMNVLSVFLIT